MSQREQGGDLYRRVNHKEGTHLAPSHDTAGAFRGILFDDDNRLVAHAEWEKVDVREFGREYSYDKLPPEMQKFAEVMGQAIVVAAIFVVTEHVAPPVKRWWQNEAVPTIKEKWEILTDKVKDRPSPKGKIQSKSQANEIVIANEIVREMVSHRLEEVYEKYMNNMTSEEAQRELLEIFILSALLTKKIRKLSNARIIKNGGAPGEYIEGQEILERLTTPEYIGSINQILENNPQLMEEKTATLSGILGRNIVLNGQYVPIEIGKFKEAMALQVDVCDDGV